MRDCGGSHLLDQSTWAELRKAGKSSWGMVSDLQELRDLRSMCLHPLSESTRGELSNHLTGHLAPHRERARKGVACNHKGELCDLRSMCLHPLNESTRGELSIHLMGNWRLIVTEDESEQAR